MCRQHSDATVVPKARLLNLAAFDDTNWWFLHCACLLCSETKCHCSYCNSFQSWFWVPAVMNIIWHTLAISTLMRKHLKTHIFIYIFAFIPIWDSIFVLPNQAFWRHSTSGYIKNISVVGNQKQLPMFSHDTHFINRYLFCWRYMLCYIHAKTTENTQLLTCGKAWSISI